MYHGMNTTIAYLNSPKAIYHKIFVHVWASLCYTDLFTTEYFTVSSYFTPTPIHIDFYFLSLLFILKNIFFSPLYVYLLPTWIPFFHTINEGFACLRLLIYVMFENIKRNCFSIFPSHILPILVWWSRLITQIEA